MVRFGLAHGLDVVLRAGRLLRDRGRTEIVFLVVGDGAQFDELRADAQARELDNVIFTGLVEKERIPDILASSDACLIHLRNLDAFRVAMPSKTFEAAGMARPILMGVSGFAREFVDRVGCGLNFEPENANALVEAVLRLADDPELGKRLGKAGFDHVKREFDYDWLSERYLGLLRTTGSVTNTRLRSR